MTDWQKIADVEGVRVDRDADGEIQDHITAVPIRVKINHFEINEDYEDDPENEEEFGGGAYARFKYRFQDGTASVFSFKDVSSDHSGSNWTGLDFLKLLPVADEAVSKVPDVEEVKPAATVLGDFVDEGEEIEVDRA